MPNTEVMQICSYFYLTKTRSKGYNIQGLTGSKATMKL